MPACTKHAYRTRVAAALALRRIKARRPTRGETGIYPCGNCHAWHLTSNPAAADNRWTRAARGRLAPAARM